MHARRIVGPPLPSAPAPRVSPQGAAHLTAVLTRAFADAGCDGCDPVAPRLRTLSPALEDLAEALRAELGSRDAWPADAAADRCGDHRLDRILAEIERLAVLARGPSAPGEDGAASPRPGRPLRSFALPSDGQARD